MKINCVYVYNPWCIEKLGENGMSAPNGNYRNLGFSPELNAAIINRQDFFLKNRNRFSRFFPFKKHQLDQRLERAAKDYFAKEYHFTNKKEFERVWKELGKPILNLRGSVAVNEIMLINQNFRDNLAYHGKGIKREEQTSVTGLNQNAIALAVKDALNYLLHGGKFSPRLKAKATRDAVFSEKNQEFLTAFREELQAELLNLANKPPQNPQDKILWEAYRGNILSLLPFCYPETGIKITIPQEVNGEFKPIEYTITKMDLRVGNARTGMCALGLDPEEGSGAPPILSYSGTTYPAADGFFTTILADFAPGNGVGEHLFAQERKVIDDWFDGKSNVHLTGTSLGGALCFITLKEYQDKNHISRVDVYNAPGTYKGYFDKPVEQKVNIFCQDGDLVSQLGRWPTGENVSVYNVTTHQKGIAKNFLSSHVRIFTGCDDVVLIKHKPEVDNKNKKRNFLALLHKHVAPYLIYYPLNILLGVYYRKPKPKNDIP